MNEKLNEFELIQCTHHNKWLVVNMIFLKQESFLILGSVKESLMNSVTTLID